MIVVNPVEIDYKSLAEVAKPCRGKINRIYLHWTAGHYGDVYDDYHLNIGPDGELYLTCTEFTELKAHTWRRNSGSIGIAMCCAYGASAIRGSETNFGNEPPTQKQIEAMAKAVAVLAYALGLEIKLLTVTTHCEAALFDGYGPHSGDPETRWDLWFLPDRPLTEKLVPGGNVIRGKAQWYRQFIGRFGNVLTRAAK